MVLAVRDPCDIGKAFAESLAADGHDLIIVGRREARLKEFLDAHPDVDVQTIAADLSTDEGVDAVAEVAASQPLELLINNAGVAHYMPLAELSVDQAKELTHIKNVAPMLLTRAALPGMLERGKGTIVNIAGMIAFSGPAPGSVMPRRAVQGMDLSSVPRMSADDVVTACRRGLELGEVVTAPGVEDASLLQQVFDADLAAFGAQSPQLASRYRRA